MSIKNKSFSRRDATNCDYAFDYKYQFIHTDHCLSQKMTSLFHYEAKRIYGFMPAADVCRLSVDPRGGNAARELAFSVGNDRICLTSATGYHLSDSSFRPVMIH